MFGIGKKNEAKGTAAKAGKEQDSDEIQFDFEENDKLPFDEDEGFADEEFSEEEFVDEPARKGALSRRTLLLGLFLLLALGGGAYYYLNSTPVPPPKPVKPVKAKMAVKPSVPAPAPSAQPSSPTPVPAVTAPKTQPAPAAQEKIAPPAAKTLAVATPPVATPPPPTAAVAAPSEVKNKVVTPPVARQSFTLSAGAFLGQENVKEVETKIRRLGYTPKVQTTYNDVPMTRLLLGIYDDPAAAVARSQALAALVPDLFSMKQGDKVAIYAGSYQNKDQARRFAEKLHQQGILADEETVSVRMPLKKVSYGSFTTRAAAEKAAKRAVSAGLTAQVVKR